MIGLDTNVLIRYLTQDDAIQTELANNLIEKELSSKMPGHITSIALIEVAWVLQRSYEQSKDQIIRVITGILESRQLLVENAEVAYLGLKRYSSGKAGFSDAVIAILSESTGCKMIMTFDKKAETVGIKLLTAKVSKTET